MAGSIKVDLPSDFDADADVSTMVGKIHCDFAQPEKGMVSSFIKTKFNNGGKPFKCSTMAGSITISKNRVDSTYIIYHSSDDQESSEE